MGEEHLNNFTEQDNSVSKLEAKKVVNQSSTAVFSHFSTAQNHAKQTVSFSKNVYVCFFSHTLQDIFFKNIPLRAPPVLA